MINPVYYGQENGVRFTRRNAPVHSDTFACKPIGGFVASYLVQSRVSVDPFARDCRWATHTNDIDPTTQAEHHMDARRFLRMMCLKGVRADLVILDPPYSSRQISDCYNRLGMKAKMHDTQNSRLYKEIKDLVWHLCTEDATVLSFGWNSVGMGISRGFEVVEVLMVCHGSAHNDTLCIAERRRG